MEIFNSKIFHRITKQKHFFLLLCITKMIMKIECQFPTVCMPNATLPMAVCCPALETGQPCGGSARGTCQTVNNQAEMTFSRWSQLSPGLQQDDRLNWPLRFFTFVCQCHGNYAGAGCEKCKFGYTGPTCETRLPKRIRQSIWKMSLKEQHRFIAILNASKYTPSNYSVINVDGPDNADPITRDKLSFKEVSIYDNLVYYHYYAARTTMFDDGLDRCSLNDHRLDFAHKGPGFLPWHRHYMLMFEESLSHVAQTQFGQKDFALPYWDWTNQTDCLICTNHLVGDFYNPNISVRLPRSEEIISQLRESVNTTISPKSPFSKWKLLCQYNSSYTDPCFYCDIHATKEKYLTRTYSERPGFDRFASQEEMNYVMSSTLYDVPPFDANSPNTSFRNNLEGFSTIFGRGSPMNTHSLAHNFFSGVFRDRASSPNDPVFIFHHIYIDKVFDIWLQATLESGKRYPTVSDLPFGHHANDVLVPSFPPVQLIHYFVEAETLGYGYDDHRVGVAIYEPLNFQQSSTVSETTLPIRRGNIQSTVIVALAAVIFMFATVCLMYTCGKVWRQRRLYRQASLSQSLSQSEDSTPSKKRAPFWKFKTTKKEKKSESTPLL